jgi:hypothetical protein
VTDDVAALAALRDVDTTTIDAVMAMVWGQRPAWHAQAACRGQGPDAWFPARGEDYRPALAACAGCPVAAECARAGAGEQDGIWAGQSPRARRRARRTAA